MPEEQQHRYSVQIHGPYGLQVISVLAGSDREAVKKLSQISGRNSVHSDTFKKDGQRTKKSTWSTARNE